MTAMSANTLPHDHGNAGRVEQLKKILDRTEKFSAAAEAMSLLADASRLRIFWLLCHCEECVLNISAITGMSSPAYQIRDRRTLPSNTVPLSLNNSCLQANSIKGLPATGKEAPALPRSPGVGPWPVPFPRGPSGWEVSPSSPQPPCDLI